MYLGLWDIWCLVLRDMWYCVVHGPTEQCMGSAGQMEWPTIVVCEEQLRGSQVVLVTEEASVGIGILYHPHHVTVRVNASNVVLGIDVLPE